MRLSLTVEPDSQEASATRRNRTPACSRLAHETSQHRQAQRGTASSGEKAKTKVDSPVTEPDGSLGTTLK
jgi:hypothetical protein